MYHQVFSFPLITPGRGGQVHGGVPYGAQGPILLGLYPR